MTRPANFASRRSFLKNTGRVAAASALAGVAVPAVHAAENNTIQVALIGCGGRGTGAAANALSAANGGPIKLVAMADAFADRVKDSHRDLTNPKNVDKNVLERIDVPEDRRFVGFDAYKKAMDCLKPGDVALFATPPAFRWVHFAYAISKGLNVFMEKPVSVDGPSTRRMIELGEEAAKKNLKVGVGLMCRHCVARAELLDRIQQGEIGPIIAMRAYRMHGPAASFRSGPKPAKMSELEYQIRRFHSFIWASGGCFSDFNIHNIDECCWMKGGWPVQAQASGGRHYRENWIDQNFDNYSVEYTFDDGAKLFFFGRSMNGCKEQFASYAHGAQGLAVISEFGHSPTRARIYKGQKFDDKQVAWKFRGREPSPHQLEWDHLIAAIRQDKPFNEVKRGAEASLVAVMGRMAAHTGEVVTFKEAMEHPIELAPTVDKLAADSPAPVLAGPDGKYPVPRPGILKDREY
jgi:predicted dehydrogenase